MQEYTQKYVQRLKKNYRIMGFCMGLFFQSVLTIGEIFSPYSVWMMLFYEFLGVFLISSSIGVALYLVIPETSELSRTETVKCIVKQLFLTQIGVFVLGVIITLVWHK